MATIDEIRRIEEPSERAKAAEGFIQRGTAALADGRAIRDAAIVELRKQGWTQRRVAELLGMTPAAVNKIDRAQGIRSTRKVERAPKK